MDKHKRDEPGLDEGATNLDGTPYELHPDEPGDPKVETPQTIIDPDTGKEADVNIPEK